MFKRLVFGLVFIILGVLLAAVLLLNPLEWGWIQPVQYAIYHAAAADDGHNHGESETAGQLWTCGMHPQVIQDEPGDCPICGMDLTPLKDSDAAVQNEAGEKKIEYWVAPMDPNFVSDKPGKSPMGMDLVPVYEESQPGSGAVGVVHIDPSFVQNIGVQWVDVERRDIPVSIRTIGTVAYNDRRISLVNIKYSGWIEDVQVNYVGESVRKGQKLFEIYSPDLVTTQKEYLNALDYAKRMNEGNYPDIRERAESLLESSRKRLRNWDLTPGQIEELGLNRQPRRTITVFSPADGVVISKMDQSLEGMYVKPGMNLYKIADLSTVWVEAEIFESQLPLLKVGQRASLEFPSLPGKKYRGTIRYMYPFLDQKSRTMKVSIEIANPGLMLRKDMYADVTFDVPSANQVLTVPEDSVIHSGRRNVVVLSLGEGAFQVKEVELGINGDHVWEVRQGIMEGDKVVTSSQFLIDSESNLRAAIQKTITARARKGEEETASVDVAEDEKPMPDTGAEDPMPASHVH
jgi:membrane fusion protein, copper/silver efflux system